MSSIGATQRWNDASARSASRATARPTAFGTIRFHENRPPPMTSSNHKLFVLGLDIGGANLKAADSAGFARVPFTSRCGELRKSSAMLGRARRQGSGVQYLGGDDDRRTGRLLSHQTRRGCGDSARRRDRGRAPTTSAASRGLSHRRVVRFAARSVQTFTWRRRRRIGMRRRRLLLALTQVAAGVLIDVGSTTCDIIRSRQVCRQR